MGCSAMETLECLKVTGLLEFPLSGQPQETIDIIDLRLGTWLASFFTKQRYRMHPTTWMFRSAVGKVGACGKLTNRTL